MKDLVSFQRDLLIVINGSDSKYPLNIKEQLDEYYEKEVPHGRLFTNLDTLVEKGYVTKEEADDAPKNPAPVHITKLGKEAISNHLNWREQASG